MSDILEVESSSNVEEEEEDEGSFSHKMRRSISRVKRSIQKITEDLQDEEESQIYIRPDSLSMLSYRTGFSRERICRMYREFKQHSPRGAMTWPDLRATYTKLFPLGDSSRYTQIIFNAFDQNKDGLISFADLILGLASIVNGNVDDKLHWIFSLYDLNGDGQLTRHELLVVVSSIYEMVRNSQSIQCTVGKHVDRLFEKMDLDKDGVISKEEFMISCKNDQTIRNQLSIFNNCI